MGESDTRKHNRKKLTEYWEAKGVHIPPNETIDDYVVVPGDKTDWAFYPVVEWIRKKIRRA